MATSRVAIIVIIAGTITADTVTAFFILAIIPTTGTADPELASRFRSTSWHMPDCSCFRETNSGDASFVTEK